MASEDRFERVTNLVTFLLNRDRGATFAEILTELPGWPESADARRRAFERDKKVLRDEGIPLVEEDGVYRIPPELYYLPDLGLSAEEQVALRLAVAAVPLGGDSAGFALHKLTLGAGEWEGSASVVAALDEQPLLPTLHAALRRRSVVGFAYGGEVRDVEPTLLMFRDGNWYLVGFDRGRGAMRSFRVDRMRGDVTVSDPGAFERAPTVPEEAMPEEPWGEGVQASDGALQRAVVDIDPVLAAKAMVDVGGRAAVETRPDGSIRITMDVTNRRAFRSWLLGMLDHAEVVEPPELREDMVAWLEAIVAAR